MGGIWAGATVGGALTSVDQPSGCGNLWVGSAADSELISVRSCADVGDELEEVNKVESTFLLAEVTSVDQEEES